MPEMEKMAIELVDGWQQQKSTSSPYSLGEEYRQPADTILCDLPLGITHRSLAYDLGQG